MTNKEKQYIKELGPLYVLDGYDHITCGGHYGPTYKKVDVIEYIEKREYNEHMNTYMKYRTAQRYDAYSTCQGGIIYEKSSGGDYVIDEKGKYLNIKHIESKLKPEDIEKRVSRLKSVKYKDYLKFSRVQMNGSDTFAYVEDANGHFVYDNNAHKFIDITD